MEFRSRDDYRKAIEAISGLCRHSEREIAEALVALCAGYPADSLRGHVGWWLVDEGQRAGTLYAGALGLAWLGALAAPAAHLWWVSAGPLAWADMREAAGAGQWKPCHYGRWRGFKRRQRGVSTGRKDPNGPSANRGTMKLG